MTLEVEFFHRVSTSELLAEPAEAKTDGKTGESERLLARSRSPVAHRQMCRTDRRDAGSAARLFLKTNGARDILVTHHQGMETVDSDSSKLSMFQARTLKTADFPPVHVPVHRSGAAATESSSAAAAAAAAVTDSSTGPERNSWHSTVLRITDRQS